jgi:hypothetical protein
MKKKFSRITFQDNFIIGKISLLNEYLKELSKISAMIDKQLDPFNKNLTEIEYLIKGDPTALNIHKVFAWPLNFEEWKKVSISTESSIKKANIIGISYNVFSLNKQIIPPLIIFEISFFGKNSLYRFNTLEIKIGKEIYDYVMNDFASLNNVKLIQTVYELVLNNFQNKIAENLSMEEKTFVITDLPLTCEEFLNWNKEEIIPLYNTIDKFLKYFKSINVIPVSIVNYESSPLINSFKKYFFGADSRCSECIYGKPMCSPLNIITDKFFLKGKVNKKERSPLLKYINSNMMPDITKEEILIFYINTSTNYLQRIEIPYFAMEHIQDIHYVLLKEYEKCYRVFKKDGFYSLMKAKRLFVSTDKNIVQVLDAKFRKETAKQFEKEIGLLRY